MANSLARLVFSRPDVNLVLSTLVIWLTLKSAVHVEICDCEAGTEIVTTETTKWINKRESNQ